jgi:two-component system, LytTR family, response regulator
MGRKIHAFIVDDERSAREDLSRELSKFPDIEIVGEAESVESAAKLIPKLAPDLLFLDIQMPGGSGFTLFDRVEVNFDVVFVTAFDSYAIRAFEVNALDYLLKPVCPERLAKTIARLSRIGDGREHKSRKKQLKYDDHVLIKTRGRIGFVKVDSIIYISASGDYTDLFAVSAEKKTCHKPLRQWEEDLPADHFIRINRAEIINVEYLERVEPRSNSTYEVYLRNIREPFITSRKNATYLRERFVLRAK